MHTEYLVFALISACITLVAFRGELARFVDGLRYEREAARTYRACREQARRDAAYDAALADIEAYACDMGIDVRKLAAHDLLVEEIQRAQRAGRN